MAHKSERNVALSILRNLLLESTRYRIEITNAGKRADQGVRIAVTRNGRRVAESSGESLNDAIRELEDDWISSSPEPPASERVRE